MQAGRLTKIVFICFGLLSVGFGARLFADLRAYQKEEANKEQHYKQEVAKMFAEIHFYESMPPSDVVIQLEERILSLQKDHSTIGERNENLSFADEMETIANLGLTLKASMGGKRPIMLDLHKTIRSLKRIPSVSIGATEYANSHFQEFATEIDSEKAISRYTLHDNAMYDFAGRMETWLVKHRKECNEWPKERQLAYLTCTYFVMSHYESTRVPFPGERNIQGQIDLMKFIDKLVE